MLPAINRSLSAAGGRRTNTAPGKVSIVNGVLTFDVGDPGFQRIVDEANRRSGDILAQRSAAFSNLARITGGIQDLSGDRLDALIGENEALLNRQLDVGLADQREDAIERANRLGFSPGAQLGEIAEGETTARQEIRAGLGIQRAVALLGGQLGLQGQAIETIQGGLNPTLAQGALAGLSAGRSTQQGGLDFGLQLAIAKADASSSRAAGISDAIGGATAALLSTDKLKGALGGKKDGT